MRSLGAGLVMAATLTLAPSRAHATHPDHEGERGLEAQLVLGGGGYDTHGEAVFVDAAELGRSGARYDVFRGGFALRALVGWRFTPYLAAHVGFGFNGLSSAGQYAPMESAAGAADALSSWSVSLHARFYWLSLLNGAQSNPRVFFRSWSDVRRMEAWVSLGVELVNRISRERDYADPNRVLRYTAEYTGMPVGVGYDFRFTPSLSAGVSLSLTPLFGQSMTRYQRYSSGTGSTSTVVERTDTYLSADRTNFQWFFGLGVRYTWTLF